MTRPGGPFSKPTPLTLSPTVVKATTKRSQIRLPIVFISLVVLSLLVVVALSYGFSRRVSSASPSAALKDSNPPATASSESPPRLGAGERHAAQEALRALKGLQSVTRAGVTYQDYMRRLGDTSIAVDRAADGVKDPELRSSIETAMLYYRQVGSVWNAKIQKYDLEDYFRTVAEYCSEARELLDKARSEKYPHIHFEVGGVQTMMACASNKLADVDQRLEATK